MFDLERLAHLVATHGPCIRVVTADVKGSAPREVGSNMVVWADGQDGTIGGGTLEFEAAKAARAMLQSGTASNVTHHPLGPALGQCCGGAVILISERIDQAFLDQATGDTAFARRVSGDKEQPLTFKRQLADARAKGADVTSTLSDGWWIEPLSQARQPLWIWGAGHVGRALIEVLAPLPGFDITWIDTAPDRYPDHIPSDVLQLVTAKPELAVPHAPKNAEHIILTYSHALDLALCHGLLQRGFIFAGLIGSKTKWARFRKRLANLGHSEQDIQRITCPIGDPSLGKHPQAIAIGLAAKLLSHQKETKQQGTRTA